MAASASILIKGDITSPNGSKTIGPVTISSADANETMLALVLGNGDNTITIPTLPAPKGCIITLPSDNTAITKFKGVAGDTGFAIGKTGTMVVCWDPTAIPASFVLNSAAAQTGKVTEITFF